MGRCLAARRLNCRGVPRGGDGRARELTNLSSIVKTLCLAAAALGLLAGCGGVAQNPAPTAQSGGVFDPVVGEASPIPGVETFAVASRDHVTEPVTYPQNPPVGGPHDPSWQKCEFYDAPVRNENAVHALEHGAVWITYQPDLPAKEKRALKRLAADQPYLLVSPYPGLDSPIVASAWGVQLRLQSSDDPRLKTFIDRYAGNGPEAGGSCDSGVETTVGG
jgi:hypothetical protein